MGPGFAPAVRWLEKIERRFDWLQFPGLIKALTFLGAIVFACQWIRPSIAQDLDFDRAKILEGEVWRVFSFVFAPLGPGTSNLFFGLLWLYFAIRIAFLISDALEDAWGTTRTTLYIVVGWIGLVAAHFLFDPNSHASGGLIYTSVFLAFATLYPKIEFSLMLLFPVQVRWLGWLAGALLLLSALSSFSTFVLAVPAMIPYALWVLPDVIHNRKNVVDAASRRRKFQVASGPEAVAFHKCETCGRTERDPEDLEFFVMPDGKEYCKEHLPVES